MGRVISPQGVRFFAIRSGPKEQVRGQTGREKSLVCHVTLCGHVPRQRIARPCAEATHERFIVTIARRITRATTLVVLLGSLATATACNDEITLGDDEPVRALVASWDATSFTAGGTEFVATGLTFRLVLAGDNRYSMVVKSDLDANICEPGMTACTINGPYTSTATTITLDAGTGDATTLNYTIAADVMTWTGTIDGVTTTIVYSRVP